MNLLNAFFVFTSYTRRVPFCPGCVLEVCTLLVARLPSALQRVWIILANSSTFTQLISSSGVAQAMQPRSSRSARSESSTIRQPRRTSSIIFSFIELSHIFFSKPISAERDESFRENAEGGCSSLTFLALSTSACALAVLE